RNEAAAVAFRSAQARFDEGKFHDAAEDFAYVVERYPHAPLGRLAALYRAHALARQGDQAAAATAYGEYLASAADFDYLRQEALVGLARAKEASGDTAGALDAYTQAGALPGPYRDDALLSAARLEQAAGHADRAQAIYAGLVKDAADPETKALAAAKVPGAARPAGGVAEGTAARSFRSAQSLLFKPHELRDSPTHWGKNHAPLDDLRSHTRLARRRALALRRRPRGRPWRLRLRQATAAAGASAAGRRIWRR